MPASSTAATQPMYQKDEKTLCFHGELLYEAKVLEVRRLDSKDKTSPHEYRVHYKGWKNSWDDWVPQDRLRKLTDDNRELAANLKRELTQPPPPRSAAKAATSKSRKGQGSDLGSGRGSEERHSSVPAGGRGTKRGKDNDTEKVGPIVSSNSDCYTNSPLDSLSNQGLYSPQKIGAQGLLQSSEVTPKDPPHGFPRHTTQLPSSHQISDRETLSPYQEGSFLSNSRRGHNSPIPSTSNGNSRAYLTLRLPKEAATSSVMTLSESRKEALRRLERPSSREARKAQQALQYLSHESNDGDDTVIPAVRTQNRSSMRKVALSDANYLAKTDITPNTANSTNGGMDYSNLTGLEIVRDFLPPPDEPEYISRDTEYHQQDKFFASLIGGTTCDEKHKIEAELSKKEDRPELPPTRHPKYDKTLLEDRHNENKILFYYDQNPLQRIAIAGVPKIPLNLDPPGSQTPYDALKFQDRLVQHLNRMDPDTVVGWDLQSLKKIPPSVMNQLTPEALACMPEGVISRLPLSIRDKCSIDVVDDLIPKSEKLDENFTKLAILKLRDQQLNDYNGQGETLSIPNLAYSSCVECVSIGIKCNRELPQCHACLKFGEKCIYDNVENLEESFGDSSINESRYLGLNFSCPITQKHLNMANTRHLDMRITKNGPSSNHHPKPTFATQPNVPKLPMRNRQPKRISVAGVWQALEDLTAKHTNFTGAPSSTVPQFYTGASIETFTYPYSYPQEETFHLRPSIRITIPDHLKTLLVDDWENVTKSLLLVPVPSKAPANFIIDSYYDEEKGSRRLGSADLDVLEEFCAGMKVYFEKSVGKILLYRFERGQLAEIRHLWESGKYPEWEGKGPGDAYGAEHLCRMLVNLPELIAQTNMDNQSVNRLREEISKFCTWLARNSARFFCAKYEKPSADYIENAR